ncbi:S-layer homology domain-containing protein [Jeotgalibacillus sp. JSM ZJ347]|uniref:S-layer homology domain-containing protein n=1 Tax=Jeotgalibacillus sp. JSM ZJ347 TaxID=3342117 RepID=UPI0035A8EE49
MAYNQNYKKFVTTAATATLVASAVAPAAAANEVSTASFTDVSDRYSEAVNYLVENNLTSGLTESKFGVSETIKRGDAAIILARALELQNEDAPASGFSDVPERGALAINSLKEAGVINGKSATNFGFNDEITRGEMALILTKANAYALEGDADNMTFTDVNSRYAEAVAALVEAGITQGTSETQFGTNNSIKRGDFAIFVYRAEMQDTEETEEEAALRIAGEAVVTAESSLLAEDVAAAAELVAALPASDDKTLLEARVADVEEQIADIISDVNDATTQLTLFRAINQTPFTGVYDDYIAEYFTALEGTDFQTTAEIQTAIDAVNTVQLEADVTAAEDALALVLDVTADDADLSSLDENAFNDAVEAAQEAIDVLPADFVSGDDEEPAAALLQAELDERVENFNNYVNVVWPILNASNDLELVEALASFDNVEEYNLDEYDFTGAVTVEEIQYEIDFSNAEVAVNAYASTADEDITQEDIDALVAMVPMTGVLNENEEPTYTTEEAALISIIDGYQAKLDELNANATAIAEAEAAQEAYLAAGGLEEDALYVAVTDAITAEDFTALETATEALVAETEAMIFFTDLTTAETAEELEALLVELEVADYNGLTSAQRLEVAERFLPVVTDKEANFADADAIAVDLAAFVTTEGTGYLELIAAVNGATSITATRDALAALEIEAFDSLSASAKLDAAEVVLDNKPEEGYETIADITANF